jgi:hypothetical protein
MKGLRPYHEIEKIIKKTDLAIWDKKSNKTIDIINLVLDLINYTKTEEEFEAAIEVTRFAETIEEFTEGNKSALEFYIQHKKEIDSDKNKALIFKKKFRIQNLASLKLDYLPVFYDEDFREKILLEQDSRCGLCNKDLSQIVPHFHHIDYDKRNCAEENLIFLCPRCHGKTGSNRDFWQTMLKEEKLTPRA